MGVAEGEQGRAQLAGGVVEGVDVEGGGEVELGVGVEAPRDRRGVGEPRLAHGQVLEVPHVAPVGRDEPAGPVREPGSGGVPAVAPHVGHPAQDAEPAGGAGADPVRQAGLVQGRRAIAEGMPVLVAPLADGDIVRELREGVGVVGEDVAVGA